MRCANYEIVEDSQDCLLIQDIGPWDRYPTITNSVEEVVRQLKNILGNRKLEYFDSEGERSEILVKNGVFVGFK